MKEQKIRFSNPIELTTLARSLPLEKKSEETYGIHNPHNRIYQVLLVHGMVDIPMKKLQQRKFVQYERAHSLEQVDWKKFEIDNVRKWVVAFFDDSSRLITCWGVFDSLLTENVIALLHRGF